MKYSKDGPFSEPVVRCDSCARLILAETLKKIGMCPHCSNTRVRNVRTLPDDDQKVVEQWIKQGKVDQEWVELFEQMEI